MKVRMLKKCVVNGSFWAAGSTAEVSEKLGLALVRNGTAAEEQVQRTADEEQVQRTAAEEQVQRTAAEIAADVHRTERTEVEQAVMEPVEKAVDKPVRRSRKAKHGA